MQSLAWWVVVFSFPFWQRLSSDIQPWVSCSPHRWSSDRAQDSLKGSDFLQSFRLSPLFSGRKFPPEIKTLSLFSSFIFHCDSPSAPPPPCTPGVHCPSGSVCLSPQCTPLSLHLPSTITLRAATCLQWSACKSHQPAVPRPPCSSSTCHLTFLFPCIYPVLLFTSSPPTLPSSSSFLRSVGNSRCDSSLCRKLHTNPV